MKKKKFIDRDSKICYVIVGLVALACILPVWMAFCASFATEEEITRNGYPLFFTANANLDAYRYLAATQGKLLVRAFGVTVLATALGTICSLTVMICYGYAAAQKRETYEFSGAISMIAWFTTVFSGGVLPWYILCTRYYHLSNNIWALFVPSLMSTFHMFLLRNSFKAVPSELIEAARIDGASHSRVLFTIVLPLSKVGIVTVAMFTVLRYWNDFHLSLYLGTQTRFFTVQKLLYNMLTNLTQMFNSTDMAMSAHITASPNTARMALAVIAVLPIVVVYPFAQKYLVQGITVGAVKG